MDLILVPINEYLEQNEKHLALKTDSTLRATAHTLREENYSTIPEDRDAWEWEYTGA
jgi:hypothetical protein